MKSARIAILLVIMFIPCILGAQTDVPPVNKHRHRMAPAVKPEIQHPERDRTILIAQITEGDAVFQAMQKGISDGELDALTRYFAKHIYLNVRGVESGYYSANQAQIVLQNFFSSHKPLSFSFTTYGESGGAPYATGRGSFNVRGSREFIQVYIALTRHKDTWVVSQFNIY
jgi:hypothetical protein